MNAWKPWSSFLMIFTMQLHFAWVQIQNHRESIYLFIYSFHIPEMRWRFLKDLHLTIYVMCFYVKLNGLNTLHIHILNKNSWIIFQVIKKNRASSLIFDNFKTLILHAVVRLCRWIRHCDKKLLTAKKMVLLL